MSKIKNNPKGRKRNSIKTLGVIFTTLVLTTFFTGTLAFGDVTPSTGIDKQANKVLLEKAFKIQMPFIENQGQISDEHVCFYSKIFGGTVYVTDKGEMVYAFIKSESNNNPRKRHAENKPNSETIQIFALKEKLVGAFIHPPEGSEKRETKVNYFIGNDKNKWKTDITPYNIVSLGEVYKGIDLRLKAYGKNVEKIFTVKPGANPNAIKLKIEGASSLNINDEGELEVATGLGTLSFAKPLAYQEINGKRYEVKVAYAVKNFELLTPNSELSYGFKVGEYNKSAPLIIDPVISLAYASYLGGSSDDYGFGIAVDSAGNAYITGQTTSPDFPTSPGAYEQSIKGGAHTTAFVTKINPAGNSLVYSTYIGGGTYERALGIAVDSSGNAYITGDTNSSDFPTTGNAYQTTFPGGTSAFFTKISANGSALLYSTYLGGGVSDSGYGIAVDSTGNAYITGHTNSSHFPITPTTALQTTFHGGSWDAFFTKITPAGNGSNDLAYSTYLGGTNNDVGVGIAVDSAGNAYITGWTKSTDFPRSSGSYDITFNGVTDTFVTKINPAGTGLGSLIYSTFIGGSGEDAAWAIAADSAGNAYITGQTASTDFPTTSGAYQTINKGSPSNYNAFVTKINPYGTALLYSTYFGGSGNYGNGIAVDSSGSVYITGFVDSTDLPTANAIQSAIGGAYDAFVTKINPGGNGLADLIYSTYLGGSSADEGSAIAVDNSGSAYITGFTSSTNFPATPGAYQTTLRGGSASDAFVAKISLCTYSLSNSGVYCDASGCSGTVYVTTPAGCTWTAVSNDSWIHINGSGNGWFTYTVDSNFGGFRTGTITVATQTFTVWQYAPPPPCSYSLSSYSASPPASGGTGYTVGVTAGAGCGWTATTTYGWITITGGSSGAGNGTVTYNVAANSGPQRTGTMSIAGYTFTVTQASGCTYTLSSYSASVPASGGTGYTVGVTAGAECGWTATTTYGWITITGGSSGSGNGTVTYSVTANSGVARAGSMTIAGQTFTVTQDGGGSFVPYAERAALIDLYNSTTGSGWINSTNWLSTTVSECNWYGVACTGNHVMNIILNPNKLAGTIPSSIGNLTYLQNLKMGNNQLTGSIPTQLGNLTNLQYLYLYNNQLTGSIPAELSNLTNLNQLLLEFNQLTGSIPTQLGSLTNLWDLGLEYNQLTGSIPTQLGNLTNLRGLGLNNNQLTGSIPTQLGSLANLQGLFLNNNQLTGSIPTQLGSLASLQNLYLYSNQLTGSIPSQLGSLTNLQQLDLYSNQLTGAMPASLINLTGLVSGNSDFRWNALYTTDSTLRTFINTKQAGGDWESTQTIAPTNLIATAVSGTSVQLTWTPIVYTADGGGYEVYYSTALGGPYTLYTTTATKSDTGATVNGLTPGSEYFFEVRTKTNPHANNLNTVYSEYTSGVEEKPLLTIIKSGNGTVRSQVAGIDCGSTCSQSYDLGTVVTLTAAPGTGSYFAGFSGGCVSQALTCKVTMDAVKTVTANFTTTPPAVPTWAKTYGGTGDDYAASIQQTSDGGYIVLGDTWSFGPGSYRTWVLKLNADGTVAWQKTYGGTKYDFAASIQQTSDGGYVLVGNASSFGAGGYDIWVLKLNADGSIAWQKTYGGTGDDYANSIQQTSDGGYIVAGYTASFGAANADAWVLKLNADGTVAWQKTYGGTGDDYAASIQQTSDGGYIVAGQTDFGAGGADAWVLKLNADGSIAWQKTYGGTGDDYAASIQQTSDGGYIVAGQTDFGAGGADAWVLKLNADGSVAWQKTYGGTGHDDALSIQQTSDGGYIATAATASFGAGGYDIWVMKLDSNGDILGCPAGLIGVTSVSGVDTNAMVTTPTPTIGDTSATVTNTNVTPVTTAVTPGGVCTGIACSYSIDPSPVSVPASGGTGYTVGVTAGGTCTWLATSNAAWITITGGASGTGNGTVTYSVATNSGPARSGTMTIAGQTFTVHQDAPPPTYTVTSSVANGYGGTVSPPSQVVTSGGTASIYWYPSPGYGFSSIQDNGAFKPIANPYVIPNVITDHNVIVTFAVCTYAPSPTSQTFTSCGGPGSFSVNPTGSNPDTCAWTVTNDDSWITVTSGSGTGPGTVAYSVAANPTNTGVWRQGIISLVGGAPYTVREENCSLLNPNPTTASFPSSGGTGNINITTSGSACCPWTATTSDTWIHITSGSGRSSGTVVYSVDPNVGSSRSGSISIEGLPVIIQQAGCTYSLSSLSATYPAAGGSGSVNVTAPAGCAWTAASNAAWITITGGSNGTGNGTVNYSVAANSGSARAGTMTIAGQTFTVIQPNWVSISPGETHTLALKSDGTLWAWGLGASGALGDGSTNPSVIPKKIGSDTDWIAIAAGAYYWSVALKSNGTLWTWGSNNYGQLGTGDNTERHIPTQIGTDTDWIAIAAGFGNTIALKSDGTLWAWGYNGSGILGNGSTTNTNIPIKIGTDSDWVSIAAGYSHTLALKSNGTLWAWGANDHGQLGGGTSRSSPQQVGTDTNWTRISAGSWHTVALKSNGILYTFGYNSNGQIGDNTTVDKLSPTQIGANNWASIAGGGRHTAALKSDGTLWAWGENSFGQLGVGSTSDSLIPEQIGTDTDWVSIKAGYRHTVALKSDGTLWAWGWNLYNQLGDGTNIDRNSPVRIETFTITATAGANGSISPSGAVPVNYGYSQTFTVTPYGGYLIADVVVDGSSVGPVTSVPFNDVITNHTISASFAISTCTVAASVAGYAAGGSVSPSSWTGNCGGTATFTVTTNAGYNASVSEGTLVGSTWTITNVTSSHTVTVTFTAITYTVTASVGGDPAGGSVTPSSQTVNYNGTATFTVTTNTGYTASVTEGTLVGTTWTIPNVTSSHTATVTFTALTCTVTPSVAGDQAGGSVTPSSQTVTYNGTATFTVTTNTGYNASVSEGSLVGSTWTIPNVTSSHPVTVTFTFKSYTITASAGARGTISPSGAVSVNYGGSQTFTITPNTLFIVRDVLVDGISVGAVTTYPFTNVTSDHTISASFVLDTISTASSYILDVPPYPIREGVPFSVTATFHNGTGQNILTMQLDCFNTTFTVRDMAGNIVTPRDRIRKAYGVALAPAGDLVYINDGTDSSVTCNLFDLFAPEVLVSGAYTIQATYSNYIQDPSHVLPIWMGAIASSEVILKVIPATGFYVVTPSTSGNGSIDPSNPQVVSPGGIVSFTLTPATGYHASVGGTCGGSLDSNTNIYTTNPVGGDCTVIANFSINTYTITATAGTGGGISPSGAVSVNYGSDQSFTIVPDACHHLKSVFVDGVEQTPPPTIYTFPNVTADGHTISVTFELTDTDGDGVPDCTDNCPRTPNGPLKGTCVNSGYYGTQCQSDSTCGNVVGSCSMHQEDSNGYGLGDACSGGPNSTTSYTLGVPSETTKQGTSFLMTATFHNGTGQDILTMQPDCFNTTFTVKDMAGNIVPPRDRIRTAYGIALAPAGDLVYISKDTDSTVACDILDLFAPEVLIPGAYTVQATYSNYIQDPTGAHNLWMGAIHSTEVIMKVIPATGFYVVTPSAGPNGSIDPPNPQAVSSGGIVSFTLTPATGYHIASVSGCGGTLNGTTYTTGAVNADCPVTASFAINTYRVTPSAGPNGSINPSTAQTVNYNATTSFTISPNTGYHIASVTGCGGSLNGNTYTTGRITADCAVNATFAINTYTITATAGPNGSITPSGTVTVNYGTDKTFTITPNASYHVADVLVDGVSVGALTTYTFKGVKANHTISASFSINRYVLTVTKAGTGSGTVTASPGTLVWNGNVGTATYDAGTKVTLTATPDASSTFTGWTASCSGSGSCSVVIINSVCTVNMCGPCNATATFAIKTNTITATAGTGGSISPSGNVKVNYGADKTFTITPNTGYQVLDVKVDNVSQGAITTYTFTKVTANHTISATFKGK